MRDHEEVVLTPEGVNRLREELAYLRRVRRKEVTDQIRESLDFGDAWENPEYGAAKAEQAFVEGRIQELERMLRAARVVQPRAASHGGGSARVGSQIRLLDLETGSAETYTIVGSAEADPARNRISHRAPVAQALIGHRAGDVVEVQVPAGVVRYRILAIEEPQARSGEMVV